MKTILTSILPMLLASVALVHAADSTKSNVILILSDDQGFTDYGFMVHKVVQAPSLDRMASQSLLYTRGYVMPACSPSGWRRVTASPRGPTTGRTASSRRDEEKNGHHLELNDTWAPIVIQMSRAKDCDSFEAFQKSVKARKFEYENGKLTYESEANDKYEYWAKGTQIPKVNDTTVNLNPAKTYDSPYLSLKHGENKAVIHCAGYEDLVLDFGSPMNPEAAKAQISK